MIRTSFLLVAALFQIATGCPGAYEPWIGGRCMRFTTFAQWQPYLRVNCRTDGGELVSIHSDEENERIRLLIPAEYDFVSIGLACNETSSSFFWVDGTPIDYSNGFKAKCTSADINVMMRKTDGAWILKTNDAPYVKGICSLRQRNNVACNDYEEIEGSLTCVSLHTDTASWIKAEQACKREAANLVSIHDVETNNHVTARAKQLGLLSGIHIGLQTNSSDKEMAWSDGSNFTFNSFAKGFPNDIFGHCTAIQTNSHAGEWLSNACDSSNLPYACGRPAYDIDHPISPDGCPESPYYFNADTVYSPSYPGSPNATSCDYFLAVEKGSHVKVTIDDLSLNVCCDKLELSEGALGGAHIATLTGESPTGQRFYTSSSNIMRLSLTSIDGRFVRGFRAHFEKL